MGFPTEIFMTTEKELAEALKKNPDTIEIEGDLARKVVKIKATGAVTWGACLVMISFCAFSAAATVATAGTAAPATTIPTTLSLGVAATAWGVPTATTAVSIAIAGGIRSLDKLRKYKLTKISDEKIRLTKR